MSVAKPGATSNKRHKVKLHSSAQPPTKKVRSAPLTKHMAVEKAFEQPAASFPPEAEGFGRFAPPVEADDDKQDEEEESVF
ncbi:hypothetical protein OS493_032584 [Desmophyllum pertusum]|uniref:Uncharacterized protein n=1 Tax=Desmophyllum pertusum TaxID=174260 RepID=A0A9W9YZE9_9CNID|nr:hypothetical protein OS493_032584 [Desmophyllum pertusum]